MRLLMIDDDEALAQSIAKHFIQQNYAVDIAVTGEMGLEFMSLFDYDLIILDLMLPDADGQTICKKIRQDKHQMPVLMLTVKESPESKISGLDAGADDYLIKPVHIPELLARTRALIRRSQGGNVNPELQWGDLTLNLNTFEVIYKGTTLALTPKEYAILELFVSYPQKSQTLDAIIDNIWAMESPPSLYAIRTHIKGLRQKLKEAGGPSDFIETLYGFGYRLNPLYESVSQPISESVTESKQESLEEIKQELWSQRKSEIEARIAILDEISQAKPSLLLEFKDKGIKIAHKLAGSLGCYGFEQGALIARQIEQALSLSSTAKPIKKSELQDLIKQLKGSIETAPPINVGQSLPLLVYSENDPLAQNLIVQQASYNIEVIPVQKPTSLAQKLREGIANLVLLDVIDPDRSLTLLNQLKTEFPHNIIMIVLNEGDWLDRIDYIDQGASRIFQAPASAEDILDTAQQLRLSTHARAKILMVDDDETILAHLKAGLGELGFDVTILNDSRDFWPTLHQTQPDVLVLDIAMPDVDGLELCKVLRSDSQWEDLPVLFLTAHQDTQTEDHAFGVGGDDFIPKSFPINRLALRIQNRLR